MKMMLAKIVSSKFRKSLDNLASQELPMKAMFLLKGIVKQLREEILQWDETQLAAAKKWADKNEAGEPILEKQEGNTSFYKMSRENMIQFAAELGEAAKMEIEIRDVKISDLGSVKLTIDDLVELEFLVED